MKIAQGKTSKRLRDRDRLQCDFICCVVLVLDYGYNAGAMYHVSDIRYWFWIMNDAGLLEVKRKNY